MGRQKLLMTNLNNTASAEIKAVHQFVDDNLNVIRQHDMMKSPGHIPAEMQDDPQAATDDWLPWKPVDSTVSTDDIKELEQQIHLRYPKLYLDFLQYKHFCELWPVADITFFPHDTASWKQTLLSHYQESWLPEKLIEQGYIYFADYSDWGIVCFDTTRQSTSNFDCPIIMIDHDLLFSNPVPHEELYASFAEMMQSLLEEQKNPTIVDDE